MLTLPSLAHESKTTTPAFDVYYASIQGIAGVCLSHQGVVHFAPTDDPSIYLLTDTTHLLVTAQITNPAIATYVRADVAQRLLAGARTVGGVA